MRGEAYLGYEGRGPSRIRGERPIMDMRGGLSAGAESHEACERMLGHAM